MSVAFNGVFTLSIGLVFTDSY